MIALRTTVGELMSRKVLVAKADYPFSQISRLFQEMDIHHLPIVDRSGRLVGIISANDMLKALNFWLPRLGDCTEARLNANIPVEELMTPNPIVIGAEASADEAARLFKKHNIRALPVLDNGELVGIITSRDLIRFLGSE